MLNKLGGTIADEVGELPRRAVLFVHVEDKWADVRLFIDRGKFVQHMPTGGALPQAALKIWALENAGRPKALRWTALEYDIVSKRFKTQFIYPENMAPGEGFEDVIAKGLRKRFRSKPIYEIDMSEQEEADPVPRS